MYDYFNLNATIKPLCSCNRALHINMHIGYEATTDLTSQPCMMILSDYWYYPTQCLMGNYNRNIQESFSL